MTFWVGVHLSLIGLDRDCWFYVQTTSPSTPFIKTNRPSFPSAKSWRRPTTGKAEAAMKRIICICHRNANGENLLNFASLNHQVIKSTHLQHPLRAWQRDIPMMGRQRTKPSKYLFGKDGSVQCWIARLRLTKFHLRLLSVQLHQSMQPSCEA